MTDLINLAAGAWRAVAQIFITAYEVFGWWGILGLGILISIAWDFTWNYDYYGHGR
jgi:hypothetical protein